MKVFGRNPATLTMLLVTIILTGLRFAFPALLIHLRRSPEAFSSNEWWRVVTPIFIERGGFFKIVVNLLGILFVGSIAERLWGSRRWLCFYLAGGVAGEVSGLFWKPIGAGASVAIFGLVGALSAWLWFKKKERIARFGGATILLCAIVLTSLRDLHGPPILVGIALAGLFFKMERNSTP